MTLAMATCAIVTWVRFCMGVMDKLTVNDDNVDDDDKLVMAVGKEFVLS